MKSHLLAVVLGLFCLAGASLAHAASMSIFGVADSSSTDATGFTVGSKMGYGGGVLFGMHLGGRLSFNTGLMGYQRQWTDTTSNNETVSAFVFTVPFLFDFHLRFLHLGLGGYYSNFSGSLSESGTINNSSLSYSTYGLSTTDEGFMGDIGVHIPLGGASLRLDALFYEGVTNLATNNNNKFQIKDIAYIAGFSFPIFGPMPHRVIEGHTQ